MSFLLSFACGPSLVAALELEHRRAPDVDRRLHRLIFGLWMPLVGFQPITIFKMQAISLLCQFWMLTELVKHTRPLEPVMNTPSHHATNPQYIDRILAGTLIIWDRWFGSFEPD